MEARKIALSLIVAVVFVSGCIGGGEEEGALIVQNLDVSPQSMIEGTEVRISLEMTNNGRVPAKIDLGEYGGNVLTDHCRDQFGINEEAYNIVTTGEEVEGDGEDGKVIRLSEGQELRVEWRLDHEGDVPLHGYQCNFRFLLPFEYSVKAFQDIEIKRSRDIEASPTHEGQSSSGPLFYQIQTDGSTADEGEPVFVAGEDPVTVYQQFQNIGQSADNIHTDIKVKGETLRIQAGEPLQLNESFVTGSSGESNGDGESESEEEFSWEPEGYSEPKCDVSSLTDLRILDGQTRILSCSLGVVKPGEIDEPAEVARVEGFVDYTYRKNLGTRTVEVKPRGF